MGKVLKLATSFSGIGAIEQSLKRLGINHEIVFACDNGNINLDIDYNNEMQIVKSLSSYKEKNQYVKDIYKKKSRKTNFVEQTYLNNYKILGDIYNGFKNSKIYSYINIYRNCGGVGYRFLHK